MWVLGRLWGKLKGHFIGLFISISGLLLVAFYIAFEYGGNGGLTQGIASRPLEHLIIFSIAPISAALGYLIDLQIETDREMANALMRTENLINTLGEGLIEIGKDYRVLSINDFALDLVKMSRAEVLGKKCYELFHKLNEICPDCPVKVTFETGKPGYTTHTGIAKNGTQTQVELNSYPLPDKSGEIISVIETVKDISERKKLEEEIVEKQFLERIGKIAVERELKMVELKKRIIELEDRVQELETTPLGRD